jgi:uncharacterized delta-60 repeat protein
MIVGQYTANGTPDASFGVNGFIEISNLRGTDARGNAITLQDDGRIIIAGVYDQNPAIDGPDGTPYDTGFLARILPTGALDTTFGTAGFLELSDPAGLQSLRPSQLALQSDGKIMVVGELGDGFSLARITTDGHMDTSYGDNDGFAILDSLPTGFRETRLGNIGYGANDTPYSYDTPSLTMGVGLDVDKAIIVGNYAPVGTGAYQYGGYTIVRVQGDNTPPTAQAQMSNVTQADATSYSFYVTYTDNVLIDPSSIAAGNVQIVAPGGADPGGHHRFRSHRWQRRLSPVHCSLYHYASGRRVGC